jgi:putative transposase
MIKCHVIKLNPTTAQKRLFAQACGCKRKSYNWALSEWNKWLEDGKKPSAMSLIKHQNSIKKTEMAYFLDVSKTAPQYAIWDLQEAWTNYFRKLKNGSIAKEKAAFIKNNGVAGNEKKLKEFGKPKFKKKGKCIDSFVAIENNQQFKQSDFKIHIPRVGKVKCFENLRFDGKVNNVVIKRVANDWFAVVNIDIPVSLPLVSENQATIGIDMGISKMMVCSDGTIYENTKALKNSLKGIKRAQRSLSRKVKGSNNRFKQSRILATKHQRVYNIRKNAIHQATTDIIKKGMRIVVEDLNVKGMVKNRNLSQSIIDVSFSEIIRQLTYKALWSGIEIVKADRFYPSSKMCSCCGYKKDKLSLATRTYKCYNCGTIIDRDLNAAVNLANYSPTSKGEGREACGEVVALGQSGSMKHEFDNKIEFCKQFNTQKL